MTEARNALWLGKASETFVLLLVFALPVAFYRNTFDVTLVKALTLHAGASLALACSLMRFIELGRLELPANRLRFAAAAAALLAWVSVSFAWNPYQEASLFPALGLWLSVALFLVVIAELACVSFAAALSDWTAAAAAAAGAYAVAQAAGLDPWPWKSFEGQAASTLGHPDMLGAFLGMAFPAALSRSLDRERPVFSRAASLAAALICPLGVLASGSPAGLLALCVSCAAFATGALRSSRNPAVRAAGLAAAALAPAALAAALLHGGALWEKRALAELAQGAACRDAALRLWKDHAWLGVGAGGFATAVPPYLAWAAPAAGHNVAQALRSARSAPLELACELGLFGALLWAGLLAAALGTGWLDLSRRLGRGEAREGTLMLGLWAGAAGLLAAGASSHVLAAPAPGLFLWLFAAAVAGLARERGSAEAAVIPIPASPAARRLLHAPVAAALACMLAWPGRALYWDIQKNLGVYDMRAERLDSALERFGKVSSWHPAAAHVRGWEGFILSKEANPLSLKAALERYREALALAPNIGRFRLAEGVLLTKLGDWRGARESLRRAVALEPRLSEAYPLLAESCAALGLPDEERAAAVLFIRAFPDDPSAWRFIADHYRERKRYAVARRMLEKAARVQDVAGGASTPLVY